MEGNLGESAFGGDSTSDDLHSVTPPIMENFEQEDEEGGNGGI